MSEWQLEAYGEDEWLQFTTRHAVPPEEYFLPSEEPRVRLVARHYKAFDDKAFISRVYAIRAHARRVDSIIEKHVRVPAAKAALVAIARKASAKWINYVRILGKDPEAVRREVFMTHCTKLLGYEKCDALYQELLELLRTWPR